jgi:hypothetical protein
MTWERAPCPRDTRAASSPRLPRAIHSPTRGKSRRRDAKCETCFARRRQPPPSRQQTRRAREARTRPSSAPQPTRRARCERGARTLQAPKQQPRRQRSRCRPRTNPVAESLRHSKVAPIADGWVHEHAPGKGALLMQRVGARRLTRGQYERSDRQGDRVAEPARTIQIAAKHSSPSGDRRSCLRRQATRADPGGREVDSACELTSA